MSNDRWAQLSTVEAHVKLVLLVEDDPDSAAVTKLTLERNGMAVKVAKDGGQAQSSFLMQKPDLVILDLMLPGESGFEICDRLKHSDASTPIVILTAIDSDESRSLAARVGADAYLTKPADPDQLIETIRQAAQTVWAKSRMETKETDRIRFDCICGKRFRVSAEHKGRSMYCPRCGEPMIVPS